MRLACSVSRGTCRPTAGHHLEAAMRNRRASACGMSVLTNWQLRAPLRAGVHDSAVSTGGADELGRLYEENRDRLWRGVYAVCGDPDIASDAVAEAFAQALRRGDAIRDPLAWVWRAALRIAAGELKDRSRRMRAEVAEEADEMPVGGRELINELGRLSPKQRAAIVLKYYEGYSNREIAEIIGSTAAAVRVHLAVGRRRLRDMLEGRDDA